MERDFEKEFKELKQSEAPDLWNRIEAGLSPKDLVSNAQTEVEQNVKKKQSIRSEQDTEQDQILERNVVGQGRKSGQIQYVHRWALLAAACLCVLIIVPVLSLMRSNSSSSGMSADMSGGTEASSEDGGWSAGDEAAATESESAEKAGSDMNGYADEESDGASDIYAGVDESVKENVMEDSLTNGLESSKSGSSSAVDSFSDDSDMRNGVKKELQRTEASMDSASSKMTADEDNTVDRNSVLQEGQLLNAVKIRISEIEQTDDSNDAYTVRAVIVSSDEDNYLSESMELTLLCNAETAYDFVRTPRENVPLQTGETYTADLRYEGYGDFVIVKVMR